MKLRKCIQNNRKNKNINEDINYWRKIPSITYFPPIVDIFVNILIAVQIWTLYSLRAPAAFLLEYTKQKQTETMVYKNKKNVL